MKDLIGDDLLAYRKYKKEGYTHVPLVRKILADTETPVGLYHRLAQGAYSFLFESVLGGEQWGRYSIIGLPAKQVIQISGCDWCQFVPGDLPVSKVVADPLGALQTLLDAYRVAPAPYQLRFMGGWVGYFGYESNAYFEPKLALPPKLDPLNVPDICLFECLDMIVFDNLEGSLYLITHADTSKHDGFESAQERLSALLSKLSGTKSAELMTGFPSIDVDVPNFESNTTQASYEGMVERVKAYILDGDVMQVVPSHRMKMRFDEKPFDLYRALRVLNPSPYLYFLNMDDHYVVGSSPEILSRLEAGQVTVRPIAGTRPRGKTEEEDIALEKSLLADPKEIAEHLMLIDLGRNDVGRICEPGSVQLTKKMIVERYSHVMHIVSNVAGKVRPGIRALEVLAATFPAGTLSGAPKIRAMEIIHELEHEKRGIYSGAVGYISWQGEMDTAIAIRTSVIKDGYLYVQAGAGVVADSVPESEWQETLSKGRAILVAAALVQKGLGSSGLKSEETQKGGRSC